MPRKSYSWVLLGAALFGLASVAGPAHAQQSAEEYELKAAWLFKMCQYTTWANDPPGVRSGEFVIGVVGPDPFGAALDVLRDRKVNGRKVVVRRFAGPKDFRPCHLAFVSAVGLVGGEKPADRLESVLRQAEKSGTLVMADAKGLAHRGAMVNFFLYTDAAEKQLLGFEVNLEALKAAGLQMKPQLLKLAVIVDKDRTPAGP